MLVPLADAVDAAQCGAKAAGLSRLIAAGLRVPDGFVITTDVFRSLVGPGEPDRDAVGHALEHAAERIAAYEDADLVARAASLGRLVVRSSTTIEDTLRGSGAGIFASVVDVTDVVQAVRSVWISALAPLAFAYGRGRPIEVAVIVQRFVPGERVTVYTRAPADASKMLVQRSGPVTTHDRDIIDADNVEPSIDTNDRIDAEPTIDANNRIDAEPGIDANNRIDRIVVATALQAEVAIGATTGADVEMVIDAVADFRDVDAGDVDAAVVVDNLGVDARRRVWVVQARPIVPSAAVPKRVPPPPALLAALVADGRVWTWDVAHNPDPLSPAQAGLVERVERAQVAPWSMRVVAGYLYTAPRLEASARSSTTIDAASAIEARFAEILDVREPTLDIAIDRYVELYRVWSTELVPLIADARRGVTSVGARPSAAEATILAAARGAISERTAIDRLSVLAPAWDVATPTFGERPEIIRSAIARARQHTESSLPVDATADLAERDDIWFARAQALVRFALLRRGRELGIDVDDICWLSLDEVTIGVSPDDARRRAAAAKAAYERSSQWAMPLVINGEVEDRPALHGFGSGARVSGRVVRFESLSRAAFVGHGDIIVTRAITPALAVFVVGCAAIISETGGPLDHGASIARELGVPFIVGCKDAWSLLRDGTIVTIDHDVVTT